MDRSKYLRLHTLRLVVLYVCTGKLPELQLDWDFEVNQAEFSECRTSLHEALERQDVDVDGCIQKLRRAKQHIEASDSGTAITDPGTANWLEAVAMIYLTSGNEKFTRPLLEPIQFPFQDACDHLNQFNGWRFKVFELGKTIKEWEAVLSPSTDASASVSLPCIQGKDQDLLPYLGLSLSPLHPTMRTRLAPEYVRFHDRILQFYPSHASNETVRLESAFTQTDMEGEQASMIDHDLGDGLRIREYKPLGGDQTLATLQTDILIWFAGGGWMLGDIESDHNVLSAICNEVPIRIFSVAYRREPFPKPLNDAARAVQWARQHTGPSRIILGGVSAGALLTAVTTLEMCREEDPPLGMLLIAPSLDNSSESHLKWPLPEAPWLTPARMKLFQDFFLPENKDRSKDNWKASPVYAPQELLEGAQGVRTFIARMGCDILRDDAARFASQLEANNCRVTSYVCNSYPHMALGMQGILGTALVRRMMRFLDALLSGVEEDEEEEEEVLEMVTKPMTL